MVRERGGVWSEAWIASNGIAASGRRSRALAEWKPPASPQSPPQKNPSFPFPKTKKKTKQTGGGKKRRGGKKEKKKKEKGFF